MDEKQLKLLANAVEVLRANWYDNEARELEKIVKFETSQD